MTGKVAERLTDRGDFDGPCGIRDDNGNTVGQWEAL